MNWKAFGSKLKLLTSWQLTKSDEISCWLFFNESWNQFSGMTNLIEAMMRYFLQHQQVFFLTEFSIETVRKSFIARFSRLWALHQPTWAKQGMKLLPRNFSIRACLCSISARLKYHDELTREFMYPVLRKVKQNLEMRYKYLQDLETSWKSKPEFRNLSNRFTEWNLF